MTNKIVHFLDRNSLTVLLVLMFFLQGAKTAICFYIWGTAALLLAAMTLFKRPGLLNFKAYSLECAFFVCVCFAQFFSQDASVSLFHTTQALLFWLVWLCLKSDPDLVHRNRTFDAALGLLSVATIIITALQMSQGQLGWAHSYGFLPLNPNVNAVWMATVAAFLLSRSARKWEFWLSGLLILMVLVGPSRSALIAFSGALLYILRPYFKLRRLGYAAVLLIGLFCLLPHGVLYRRLRLREGNYRLQIWRIACQAVRDHPLTGYGLGNFEMAYQRYAFPVETDSIRFGRTTEFAHNEYLQAASDLGFPAALLILAGVASGLYSFSPVPLFRGRSARASLWVMAIAACYIPIWHMPILVFLALIFSRLVRTSPPMGTLSSSAKGRIVYVLGIACLLLSIEFSLGWCAMRDYWASQNQWQQIVRWNAFDAEAWEKLAEQQADACASVPFYAKAVAYAPAQVYFHEGYGRALEACRGPHYLLDAYDEYKTALKLAPSRAVNALSMGRILFIHGEFLEALRSFQTARRIEPHYWECDLWIARCYDRLGSREKALWVLNALPHRRYNYLILRQKTVYDLPSSDDLSPYSAIILNYDQKVVEQERARIQHATEGSGSPENIHRLGLPSRPINRAGAWQGV